MQDGQEIVGQRPDVPEVEDTGFTPEDLEPRAFTAPPRHRVLWMLAVLSLLGALAVVPPLINVSRFQKRIATSISQSLGRPVHTGDVTLDLLPFPGFTISNFVVSDDPAFGSEPVIRASSVKARLRWRSLWRRRVEFSRITLADASVNLVQRPDGQWNLESIVLQASRMPAAPTAQKAVDDRPRFPYIEATGARINVKMGLEKMPVSLTDADFALWLPEAQQWRLRLEGHPARTDTAASDTGTLRLEGTLGLAKRLADVPVDLDASWTAAPLGAVSYVVAGEDAGFRGELNLTASLKGTAGNAALQTHLQASRVRRADFVPARLLEVDATCSARALANLHRLEGIHCTWPTGDPGSGLVVTGDVPDTLAPHTARLQAQVNALPGQVLVEAARLMSRRISPDLKMGGTISAQATCCGDPQWLQSLSVDFAKPQLASEGDVLASAEEMHGSFDGNTLTFPAMPVTIGPVTTSPDEAVDRMALSLDAGGFQLSLKGPVSHARLATLLAAIAPLSDGLAKVLPAQEGDPINFNAICKRTWKDGQTWEVPTAPPVVPTRRKRH